MGLREYNKIFKKKLGTDKNISYIHPSNRFMRGYVD